MEGGTRRALVDGIVERARERGRFPERAINPEARDERRVKCLDRSIASSYRSNVRVLTCRCRSMGTRSDGGTNGPASVNSLVWTSSRCA
jgi:hypothetical protein